MPSDDAVQLRARIYNCIFAGVRFEWDPAKSDRNFAERSFDFAFATGVFLGPTLERMDTRQDYGEVRRIISARVSNRRERQAYRKVFPS